MRLKETLLNVPGYEVNMETNHCRDKRADRSVF